MEKKWQIMAEKTINNYINITNTKKCPVHLSADKSFWFANHQDPAFAELKKKLYIHRMPKLYVKEIIKQWNAYFNEG